ncbi:MAG TPA: dienelactone hydrolase family protein [Candidatus Binatia bacterium]
MAVQEIRIPAQGGDIGGLLALPQGGGPFPGIVMVPTVRALDDFAFYVVERLASEGWAALGVNIFDHPGVPEDPFKRPGAQPDQQILADLDSGFDLLKNEPVVQGQPVFAWGYCLGGRFSLLWPTYQKGLAGAAAFHGFPTNDTKNPNTPAEPAGRVAELQVPVIGLFGEADRLVPMKEVERYRSELSRQNKDFEIQTYPGADHGFTNPKGPAYKPQAAEDAWNRATRFLRRLTDTRTRTAARSR